MGFPVITAVANVLAHAPGLVRYGSKPLRDLGRDPALIDTISTRLRSYEGRRGLRAEPSLHRNIEPEALRAMPRPWFDALDRGASVEGAFGDLISEVELLGLLKICDRASLVQLDESTLETARGRLAGRRLACATELAALKSAPTKAIQGAIKSGEAIPLWLGDAVAGSIVRAHEQDEALTANVLLENLATKATGVLALRRLFLQVEGRLGPGDIDFVIAGSRKRWATAISGGATWLRRSPRAPARREPPGST